MPAPMFAAYCASKSGVEACAHTLRGEVAHRGVRVGVAYACWINTDMVRGADDDDVLREYRAQLPWPTNKTSPLDMAVQRFARGISRRSPKIYAQPWIRGTEWMPRALGLAVDNWIGVKMVAKFANRLNATAEHRVLPFGPGGLAGSAASAALAGSAAHTVRPPERPAVGAPDPGQG